jgi:hypothetical protein
VAEERLSLQELDIRLKEHELRLKEVEIQAKERDLATSKWLNPVVIGLFAATLGLVGNVVVTVINSTNTQELERFRTRSTIILEAIKTNGDTNAACKNLVFFTSLGLLEDRNHTITGACPGNSQGIPSLPRDTPDYFAETYWYPLLVQTVNSSGAPISGVNVEANLVTPFQIPREWLDLVDTETHHNRNTPYSWIIHQTSGYCVSDKDGVCSIGMAPAGRFVAILTKKDGYGGNRTNILFTGTSVVVVLQKDQPNH